MILLSILIATIYDRERSFTELLEHLSAQCRRHGLLTVGDPLPIGHVPPLGDARAVPEEPREVEILWEQDNKEISIGAKRQRLLERARGRFVAFIDDDDRVSDNYVKRICDVIEANPDIDCVGLLGEHTTDGANPESFVGSLRYRDWAPDRDGYRHVRPPYHKTPVERMAALRAGFRDERFGEDHGYSMRLLDTLRREAFIDDEVLYYHRYTTGVPHAVKYGFVRTPVRLVQLIWPDHSRDCAGVPRFSVAVVVHNDAQTLPRLIRSIGAFMRRGGDIVAVDTGSTDDTVRVARRRGCRVEEVGSRFDSLLGEERARAIEGRFAREGEGPLVDAGQRLFHFGEARQHAGRFAHNDWVLQLDASDEVLALDVDALDAKLTSGAVGLVEHGQHMGAASSRRSRFYDRRLFHWQGRVQERLCSNDARARHPGFPITCAEGDLLVRHHEDEGRPRNDVAGLALDVLAFPSEPRWKHYLGRELCHHRRYRSAMAVLNEHAVMTEACRAERAQSLCLVGECLEVLEQPDEAAATYLRASALDSTRREPLLRLAALSCRRSDFRGAATYAAEALTIVRTSACPELDANDTWLPHSILYWSLFWLGRREEARRHWETCRRLVPFDTRFEEHARLFPGPTGGRESH